MTARIIGLLVLLILALLVVLTGRPMEPADPQAARRRGEALLRSPGPVLAVAAHPDDLEYYAGGTLSLLARRGVAVIAVICTDGERGGRRPDLGRVRREEQREAARILGYREVRFLGYPDRGLSRARDLEAALEPIIREVRPAAILTFDAAYPRPPYIHPDHQAAGRAVLKAASRAGWTGPVALFHTRRPDASVDITPVLETKSAALHAHRSQYDLAEVTGLRRFLIRWLGQHGTPRPIEIFCLAARRP